MATFFRFQKGTAGAAAAHLGYISRPAAVRDRESVLVQHLPERVGQAENYAELRTNLVSYAWAREEAEQASFRGNGECRTHFRALFSFERPVPTSVIRELVGEWLRHCFPQGRAVCFIHTDTAHPHAHLWLDARGVDGKKLSLAPSRYRRLDEVWNRIYSRALGRDEQEHLQKKERQNSREAEGGLWRTRDLADRQPYHARERRNAGEATLDQARTRRDQRTAAAVGAGTGDREAPAHPLLEAGVRADRAAHDAAAAAAGAIRETRALRAQLERVGQRAQRAGEEPDRER